MNILMLLAYAGVGGLTAGLLMWRTFRESNGNRDDEEMGCAYIMSAVLWPVFLPMVLVEGFLWEFHQFGDTRHKRRLELEEARQETIRLELKAVKKTSSKD